MKRILFTVIAIFNLFTLTNAQVSLTVKEETRNMSKGTQNAFVMHVPQTKAEDLRKGWEKFLKNNSKVKVEEYKNEMFVLAAVINRITNEPINHYAMFNETPGGAVITAFFAVKDSFIYSDINPSISGNIKKFMFEFGKEEYIEAVEAELKIEQKRLKEKEDELEDLHKSEDKEAKNIVECKSKVGQNVTEISNKEKEQELKQKEIMMHKEKVLGKNLNPEEKKAHDIVLKDLENQKKKLIKTHDGLRKDNADLESEIKKSEREISSLKGKQELKNKEITMQQEIVHKVEQKLEEVKRL